MKNPIHRPGVKSGTHKLGGVGKEKKIRIRSIVSPQALVSERKVKALSRFTKNMPGTPTVAHLGHGLYVCRDGNHRISAALRQGKRKIKVKVQKLSSLRKLIEFADDLQPHQKRVIRRIQDPNTTGLVVAHGLGSGKTKTAIEAHRALGGEADVILPAALRGNYEKEIAKWGADPKLSKIQSHQRVATSHEQLKSPLLIVDESHRGRNPKTNLSDAIKGSASKKRLLLTGTPIYNTPEDIATVVNQAAGKDVLREGKAFKTRYLKPGLIARWRGHHLSHENELKKVLNQYVDYHKGDPSQLPEITSKTIPVELGKHQSALYRASMGRIPPSLKLNQKNIERLRPYLTGPRQVSNTSTALDPNSHEEPKIDRAFADLQAHLKNPKGKALIYSNWLEHGIKPIQKRLIEAKIPHGTFTGQETLKARNQTVRDYNEGKHRALLVSSSGAEGLDLKGTRLVQVLEPHFNNAKIRQVVGRSARMGSHSNLPASERKVEVRQYVGRPKRRFFPGHAKGVEDMLADASRKKDEVDRQITALLGSLANPIQFAFGDRIAKSSRLGMLSLEDELRMRTIGSNLLRKIRPMAGSGKIAGIGISGGRPIQTDYNLLDDVATGLGVKGGRLSSKQIKRISAATKRHQMSATKRLIEFASGDFARKYLVGTHWTEDRLGISQQLLKGATAQETPSAAHRKPDGLHYIQDRRPYETTVLRGAPPRKFGQKGPIQKAETITKGGEAIERPLKASDLRSEKAYRAAKIYEEEITSDPGLQAASQERRAKVAEAIPSRVKNITEGHKKSRRPMEGVKREIQSIRDSAARDLRVQRPILRAIRQSQGSVPGKEGPEFLPAVAKARKKLESLVPAEQERSKNLGKKLWENMRSQTEGRIIGGMKSPEKADPQIVRQQAHERISVLERPLKGIAAKTAPNYNPLAKAIGTTPERAQEIHEKYQRLRTPGTTDGEHGIKMRLAGSRQIHSTPQPKISTPKLRTDLKKFPILKTGAIAAGVLGAGLIARKVFKKKDETEMSSNRKLIQFARGAKFATSIWGASGRASDRDFLRLAAARMDRPAFQKLKKNLGLRTTLQRERDMAAIDLRGFRRGRDSAQSALDPRNPGNPLNVTRSSEESLHRKIDQARAEGHSAGVASQTGPGTKSHFDREIRRVDTEHRDALGQILGEHAEEKSQFNRRLRKRTGIAIGSGIVAGGAGGYIARRPDEETQFGAKDLLLKGTVAAQNGLWQAGRQLGKAGRRIARKYPILRPMATGAKIGMISPIPGSSTAGAVIGAGSHLYGRIPKVKEARIEKLMDRIQNKPAIRLQDCDTLRFEVLQNLRNKINPPKEDKLHDVLTGGVEGGLGVLATDPLIKRLEGHGWENPLKAGSKAIGKKIAIGAGIGAAATGLIGAWISAASRKRKENRPVEFAIPSRGAVTQDRYRKHIHEEDQTKAESNYLRSALAGGAISSLLNKTGPLSKRFLVGAGAGLGVQAATRAYTRTTRDQFGDRSYAAKRIDNAPSQAGDIAAAGLLAKKGYDKLKAVRASTGGKAAGKIGKFVGRFFATKLPVIRFDDLPEGYSIRGPRKASVPRTRSWTDKYTKDDVNWDRRAAELRQGYGRVTGIAGDLKGVVTGEKAVDSRGRPRKREWDKPWLQHTIQAALVGGAVLGARKIAKMNGSGPIDRAAKMWHSGKIRTAADKTIPGFKYARQKISSVRQKAADEASSAIHQSGEKGGAINWILDKIEAAAGTTKSTPLNRVQKAEAQAKQAARNLKQARSQTAPDDLDALKTQKAADKANERARRKAKGQPETELKSKAKPILFDFTRDEYEDELHDYASETGRDYRHYQGDPVKRWEKLHPRVKQRKPRKEVPEYKRKYIREPLIAAGGLLAGAAIGRYYRPGSKIIKESQGAVESLIKRRPPGGAAMASLHSRDPLIELSRQLDSLLTS